MFISKSRKEGRPVRRLKQMLALAAALLLLAGCSGLSAEELYRLPEATEDYHALQAALNTVLEEGYQYTAPTAGTRQEPVQLVDLDGDGVDETVAFFRDTETGDVKVYVFSKEDGIYTVMAVDGAGSGVAMVDYADLDGQGDLELVVTYQVSEAVTQALQVYHYEAGSVLSILSDSCSRYELADLDGDGLMELFSFTSGGAESPATVKYYDSTEGQLGRGQELRLTFPYENLRRLQTAQLEDGVSAMLATGASGDGRLSTDVFLVQGTELTALDLKKDVNRGMSADFAYPTDIDGDGAVEFPRVELLPAQIIDSTLPSAVRWYGVDSQGTCESQLVTYPSASGDWYLTFPETWDGAVTAREQDQSAAVSTVDFYHILTDNAAELYFDDEQSAERILTVYTLRGAGRQEYVEEHQLTTLRSDSEIIYAVDLSDSARTWEGTITMAQVTEMFHIQGSASGDTDHN